MQLTLSGVLYLNGQLMHSRKTYIFIRWYYLNLRYWISFTLKMLSNFRVVLIYILGILALCISLHYTYSISLLSAFLAITCILILIIIVKLKIRDLQEKVYRNKLAQTKLCPKCSSELRTGLSRQCFSCGHSWYNSKST